MAKQVYLNQIEKKLTELQRERKQVLQHLVLVDEKIATLHQAIDIMQAKSRLEEHNTKLYSYRTHKPSFKLKLRTTLLSILKAEPNRYFGVTELTFLLLKADNQPESAFTEGHTVSVRGALKHWLEKGMVEREQRTTIHVRWKFKRPS